MKRRIKLTNKKQLPLLWIVKQISFYMYFSIIYQPEERPSRLSPLTEISANEYLSAGHGLALQSCVITRDHAWIYFIIDNIDES